MTLPLPPGQTPRRWQLAAVDAVSRAFGAPHRARRVLVSAATGTGKGTLLASLAVRAACKHPTARVLVLCHRKELLEDLQRRILATIRGLPPHLAASLTCGLVRAGDNGARARIVVGSVQTLRPARLAEVLAAGPPALVIVDEAHHAPARSYRDILAGVEAGLGRPPHVLGLTATPWRMAKGGQIADLSSAFDVHALSHGIVDAIREGDLVMPHGVRVDLHMALDLSGVRLGAGGDYDEEELEKAVDVDARNEAIADDLAKVLGQRQSLVFAVSVAHAKRLAHALKARGVRAEAVWGGTKTHPLSPGARDALVSRFQRGDLQVLVSRDLLFEGFDAPAVELLACCRPTQSQTIGLQAVGRGLRTCTFADGRIKTTCEIRDYCGFLDGLNLALTVGLGEGAEEVQAAASSAPRSLEPGDLCELVLPPSRGVGCVQRAAADDPIVRVLWPDGEEVAHGRPELRRVRPEAGMGPALPLVVRGQTETRVYLLPSAPEERASQRPWVWAVDAWVCSAIVRRGDPDVRARGLVRQVGDDRWEAWVGVWQGRDMSPEAPLARLPATARGVPLAAAQRAVDAALDDVGARRGGWDAAWRAEPATERQVQALRAMGRRQVAGLGKGEAGDLLDAQIVRRAVKALRAREQALQDATRANTDDTRSGAEGGEDGEE